MGTNLQNNLIVQFQGDVTTASTSVAISTDLERGAVVTASGCYAVIRNKNGSKIERVKGDAAAGTFTFTKRGLDQSDTDVEVSGLKKSWKTGQTMYITLLSSQIVDKQNSNTFGSGTTQTFVNTTASGTQTVSGASAKIDASGAKLGLRVPNVTTAERILITTNGSIVYDTDIGVHYQYIGGAWSTFATGAVVNATNAIAGKIELPTNAEIEAGTDIGGTGASLGVLPSQLRLMTPAGVIFAYPAASAPTGFLLCDGTAVSRATYATLFALISTTYGVGDGSTTFNLPNIKGRVIVGRDSGQIEFDTLGETGGAKTHTLSESEIPAHTHGVSGTTVSSTGGFGLYYAGSGASEISGSTGGGGAHNNLQPYIVLNYIIKT